MLYGHMACICLGFLINLFFLAKAGCQKLLEEAAVVGLWHKSLASLILLHTTVGRKGFLVSVGVLL